MIFLSTTLLATSCIAYLNEGVNVRADNKEKQDSKFKNYDENFTELVEMIYGEGLLSQGGTTSIEEMFDNVELENKQILDLGCGSGMYDIYLAKQHPCDITALDPQKFLVEKSKSNLAHHKDELKGRVHYMWMEDPINLKQFSDHSFDLVFSKESILHVPLNYKEEYFKEVYRVLKPGGKLLIMDWMHSSPNYSKNTRRMMELDNIAFNLQTPPEYHTILNRVGFKHVEFTDSTFQHAKYSHQNLDTIVSKVEQIINRFGLETYEYCMESWTYQRDAFATRELLTGIFRASK